MNGIDYRYNVMYIIHLHAGTHRLSAGPQVDCRDGYTGMCAHPNKSLPYSNVGTAGIRGR